MLDSWIEYWDRIPNWQQILIYAVIGNILFWGVARLFGLPQGLYRLIKRRIHRKKTLTDDFPFDKVKPNELGQKLADEYLKLTYYKNPFVPKVETHIYESSAPEAKRRRIYIGSAEIGKTRAAYKWIMDIVENHPTADILIAKSGPMPDLINQNKMPNLAETVILLYDNINKSLLKETEKNAP